MGALGDSSLYRVSNTRFGRVSKPENKSEWNAEKERNEALRFSADRAFDRCLLLLL